MKSRQKLGIILENQTSQKLKLSKISLNEKKKKIRQITLIFDIENWFWKSDFDTFWCQSTKWNELLLGYWFLAKNFSHFVPLPWKLGNPYYHNCQQVVKIFFFLWYILDQFHAWNLYWKLFRTLHSAQKVMKAKNVVNCQICKSWRFLSRKLLFTCKMVTISIKKDKTYPFVKHEPLHKPSLNWTINLDFSFSLCDF